MLVITLIPHAFPIGNPLSAIPWNQGRTLLAFRIGTPSSCVCEFALLSARTVSTREVPACINRRGAGRRRPGPPCPAPDSWESVPSMRTWGITGPLPWIARRPTRPMGFSKRRSSPNGRTRSTRFLGSVSGLRSFVKVFVHIDLILTNPPAVNFVLATSTKPLIATNIRVGYVPIPFPDIMSQTVEVSNLLTEQRPLYLFGQRFIETRKDVIPLRDEPFKPFLFSIER